MVVKSKWAFSVLIAVVAVLPAYWLGSEAYYARQISPRGVTTASDFFKRFGEPRSVFILERDGKDYYEFRGFLPPPKLLGAVPSGPPAYVFDEQGHFVTWCNDIGDNNVYRQQWPFNSTNKLELNAVKQKLGIQ